MSAPGHLTLGLIAKITGETYDTVRRRIVEDGWCKHVRAGRSVWVYLHDLKASQQLQGWYISVAEHYGVRDEIAPDHHAR